MLRVILEPAALFLAPFALYAMFVLFFLGEGQMDSRWSRRHVSLLTLAGLGLAALGVLAVAVTAPRHQGAYTPAHIESGKLVPGHMD